MIKVLIVEDSAVVRQQLHYLLSSQPDMEVVGFARDGAEAVRMVSKLKPNVVTMDIHMPTMDGLEATQRIMAENPVPVVIVGASWSAADAGKLARAMKVGAIAISQKPPGIGHPDHERMTRQLLDTIRAMSEVKVVRRRGPLQRMEHARQTAAPLPTSLKSHTVRVEVVAIGASTGGPPVLEQILSGLPKDFGAPILVVQHIAAGFLPGMVDWLARSTGLPVHIAADRRRIEAGHIYFAPYDFHMGVASGGRIVLAQTAPEYNMRPAASHLFRSVARVYGPCAVGILLTGMGKDGAQELKLMKDAGALTLAQNETTCVVYGMPREAVRLDAATYVMSPEEMIATLRQIIAAQKGV